VDRESAILIVRIVVIALAGGMAFMLYMGWRELQSAKLLPFYQVRRRRVARGWRFIIIGIAIGLISVTVQVLGQSVADRIVPALSTPEDDPIARVATAAATATNTRTPENTSTPSITPSPTERGTPMLPNGLAESFTENVTPDSRALFGQIDVAAEIIYPARPEEEEFESVEGALYGLFSYDYLETGVRWTAVWIWENEVICVESKPWDGGRGGWGYTECEPDHWPPGKYYIDMFLGEEWWISVEFTVLESMATLTPTP
jgi:type VI secretion system secreted protein VgrG